MDSENLINSLLRSLSEQYPTDNVGGNSFWDLRFDIKIKKQEYSVIPLSQSTPEDILRFSRGLSDKSKELFCPYPWRDSQKALDLLRELIQANISKRDLGYLIHHDINPIALTFLWNLTSLDNGLRVPEFGVGVQDDYHRRGLGGFCLDLLTEEARLLGADAVELTTDLKNPVKTLYSRAGYENLGVIINPLEIDQTKPMEDLQGHSVRKEYHMAKIFENRCEVLKYLTEKRQIQSSLADS